MSKFMNDLQNTAQGVSKYAIIMSWMYINIGIILTALSYKFIPDNYISIIHMMECAIIVSMIVADTVFNKNVLGGPLAHLSKTAKTAFVVLFMIEQLAIWAFITSLVIGLSTLIGYCISRKRN